MIRLDPGNDLWREVLLALSRVSDLTAVERLEPATRFADLGLSSLDLLTFAFELEDRFDVNLAEMLPERSLATLGDAHRLVSDLVAAAGSRGA